MRKLISLMLILTILMTAAACAQAEGASDLSLLILASAAEPMGAEDVPEGLMPISTETRGVNLTTSRSMLMREEALAPLYQMMRAADRDGCALYVRQAYRSYADEARRYDLLSASGQTAQKPGESSYQTGLSVTLVGADWKTKELTADFAQSAEAQWLSEHAAEYGFVLRYPAGKEEITGWSYEPWHYRYVGVAAAALMAERGLCLEELVANEGLIAQMPLDAALPEDDFEDEPEERVVYEEIDDVENAMLEENPEESWDDDDGAADMPAADDGHASDLAADSGSVDGEDAARELEGTEPEDKGEERPDEPTVAPGDIGPDGDVEIHWPGA